MRKREWLSDVGKRTSRRAAFGVAVLTLLSSLASPAIAQELTKVRYAEVVRSVFYLPAYVALSKGLFKDEGLDVDMSTAWGGDKGTAQLLGGRVDIVLQGPETAVYVQNGASPEKVKMFAALTATDGLFLVSRNKMQQADFKWGMLKGKDVFGWRPGSTPELFFEYVLKDKGIDPKNDFNNITNLAIPARMGAWLSGRGDFAVFFEPDASRLVKEGKGSVVASIGREIGNVDYTVFMATDSYIKRNPRVVQAWTNAIYRAEKWVESADATEAAKLAEPFFPRVPLDLLVDSVNRYRKIGIWKTDPATHPPEIEKLQEILVQGGVLKQKDRVPFSSIVDNRFAEKAKATIN